MKLNIVQSWDEIIVNMFASIAARTWIPPHYKRSRVQVEDWKSDQVSPKNSKCSTRSEKFLVHPWKKNFTRKVTPGLRPDFQAQALKLQVFRGFRTLGKIELVRLSGSHSSCDDTYHDFISTSDSIVAWVKKINEVDVEISSCHGTADHIAGQRKKAETDSNRLSCSTKLITPEKNSAMPESVPAKWGGPRNAIQRKNCICTLAGKKKKPSMEFVIWKPVRIIVRVVVEETEAADGGPLGSSGSREPRCYWQLEIGSLRRAIVRFCQDVQMRVRSDIFPRALETI